RMPSPNPFLHIAYHTHVRNKIFPACQCCQSGFGKTAPCVNCRGGPFRFPFVHRFSSNGVSLRRGRSFA
ncbi:hypothetical protein, partial [Achromobacter aegrifaciens]|uniref:hypothetical protein n=1 Tax=Achromobacter aegrifaciens TaxID=1287736 RepID=UPI001AD83E1F